MRAAAGRMHVVIDFYTCMWLYGLNVAKARARRADARRVVTPFTHNRNSQKAVFPMKRYVLVFDV